jgi:hypothetical protein
MFKVSGACDKTARNSDACTPIEGQLKLNQTKDENDDLLSNNRDARADVKKN